MKKYILIWLCCLNSILACAQSFKDFNEYIDKNNYVNYTRKGNKYAITVTIDGIKRTKYYPYVSPRKEGKYIPKFLMRYKKSYVFIMGTGDSYRCLTLFTKQNNTIAITDFENTIIDQSKDENEYLCFVYNRHPVVFNLNNLTEIKPIEVELSENVINIDIHSDFIELYFRKGPTKKFFFNVFCDGSSTNYDVQPYKYNGKEQDLIHGLNSYDYGARQLTMGIPRWDRVDPLAEKIPRISPYVYCLNNPVVNIDKDGRFSKRWMAKLSHSWYNLWHRQSAGPIIENKNATDRRFRYTYNTISAENGAFSVTSHYKFDKTLAQRAQDVGDGVSLVGYGLTLSVAGAEIGVPLAAFGQTVSSIGSKCEFLIDLANEDYSNSIKDIIYKCSEIFVNKRLNKLLPGFGKKNGRKRV